MVGYQKAQFEEEELVLLKYSYLLLITLLWIMTEKHFS
jgi:hypothetical protein